jgi:hypothetical protein
MSRTHTHYFNMIVLVVVYMDRWDFLSFKCTVFQRYYLTVSLNFGDFSLLFFILFIFANQNNFFLDICCTAVLYEVRQVLELSLVSHRRCFTVCRISQRHLPDHANVLFITLWTLKIRNFLHHLHYVLRYRLWLWNLNWSW